MLSKNDIVKQSFSNLKKKISESPISKAQLETHLENLEESIELLIDENRRVETCWSKMTNRLISIKNRMTRVNSETIYTLDALISTNGLRIVRKEKELVDSGKWIIVKYSDFSTWQKYFTDNPRNGCEYDLSCYSTVQGKKAKLKSFYSDKNKALEDLIKINTIDPSGKYSVCPLLEPENNRKFFK